VAAVATYLFIISSAYIPAKVGVKYCPPLSLATIRFFMVGVIVWVVNRWTGTPWPASRRDWTRNAIFGVFDAAFFGLLNLALRYLSTSTLAIVFALIPIFVSVIASRFLGERLSTLRVIGLALCFGGIVFGVVSRAGGGAGHAAASGIGFGIAFIAVAARTGQTVMFKRFPPRPPLLPVTGSQAIASGMVLLPIALASESQRHIVVSVPLVIAALFLAMAVGLAGTALWIWILRNGEASVASAYTFLSPVVAALLAALTLGEKITWRDAIGFVTILLGVMIIVRSAGRAAPARKT
jgi:drug/metabolite transporter (DMT)-like permease